MAATLLVGVFWWLVSTAATVQLLARVGGKLPRGAGQSCGFSDSFGVRYPSTPGVQDDPRRRQGSLAGRSLVVSVPGSPGAQSRDTSYRTQKDPRFEYSGPGV